MVDMLAHRGVLSEPMESPEWITLDVSSPDSSKVDASTRRPYGMVVRVYQARDGYRITSVRDGSAILWKADDHSCERVFLLPRDNSSPSLLLIHARNGEGGKTPFYYEKDGHYGENGSGWKTITESTFYSTIHKMVMNTVEIKSITLNIVRNQNSRVLYVNKSADFPFTAYAPNVGYRIKAVKEGSTVIWSAQSEDEGCLYVSLYPMYDHKLAYLIIHSSEDLQELYYSKNGTTWTTMNREEYMKKLAEAGFNESTFDNTIILDLSNVDSSIFHIKEYTVGDCLDRQLTPLPGYRLTRIMDGSTIIWKAEDGEYCTYVDVYGKSDKTTVVYLLVEDPKNGRNVLYFVKRDDVWSKVSKSDYHACLAELSGLTYGPKIDNHRIIMSSFRNRQGLKIITYSATVENAKADIILIHGIRGSFLTDYGTFNMDWSYEHYGFPTIPLASPLGGYKAPMRPNVVTKYQHLFEHACLDGMNALDVFPRYEYEGSFIEFLNKLGYNVYGMDHRSHGLSESISAHQCYIGYFKDYLHDALQFISIVKRGKFCDTNEVWNENTVFQNAESHRKLILIGYSLGGNVAMQAVQEFHRMVKPHGTSRATITPIVDGLISISGMFNLDHHLGSWWRRIYARPVLKLLAWTFPDRINPYDRVMRPGDSFDLFMRCNDPLFYTEKLTYKTTLSMFDACADVKKDDRMAHYPRNLPTFIIHSKRDRTSHVKGSRDVVNKLNEKKVRDIKLVELEGTCHILTSPQSCPAVLPHLMEWLDEHT